MGNRRYKRPLAAAATVASLALLATACGGGGGTEEGGGEGGSKEITIGMIPWDEDIAVTHLWRYMLEQQGWTVEIKQPKVGPLFQGLADGKIDVFFDTWLPATHKDYWEQFGDQLEDVGTWYDNAVLTVTVPEYVEDVNSFKDLKKNADMFGGEIIGIEAGSGLNRTISEEAFPAYGLKDAGFTFKESSTPAMLSALDDAIKNKEPIVVGLWKPHWAYAQYDLKDLKDPKNAMGDAEEIQITGRGGFGEDYPKLDKKLGEFKLNDEELFSLEDLILNQYDEGQEDKAIEEWLGKNPQFIERTYGSDVPESLSQFAGDGAAKEEEQ